MNQTPQHKEYKYIYFLATFYMSLMTCSAVLGNKLIETPMGVLSAASLVSPFWFVLGDIITEVYGLRIIMRLFWSVIICQFIFATVCLFLINLKSPIIWDGQSGYDLVLGHLIKIAVFQFIGISIAWNLNARLLNKWKILMKGRYFWLRSIGSTGIGMVIFSVTSVFPSVFGMFPTSVVISMVTWSCVLKLGFTALLAFPSTFIVIFLKHFEQIEESYSHKHNYFKKTDCQSLSSKQDISAETRITASNSYYS